jgi:plasmid maintenance system antidote protein VapI
MNRNGTLNGEVVRQLNAYLARSGKRQYELAADLGVPAPTVNRWLNGKAKVSKAYQVILKAKGIIP